MNLDIKKNINEIIDLINKNEIKKAKIKAETLINQNIKNDVVYNLLGIINLKLKNHNSAIKNFKRSLKINNSFVSALMNLAISQKEISKYDDAIKNFKKVVKLNSELFEVWLEIGLLYFKQKNYSQAKFFFTKSKESNKKFDKAYFNLGLTYLSLGNFIDASKNFEEAIKINSKIDDSHFYLGEAQRKLKNFNKAVEYYTISKNEKKDYKILQCFLEKNDKKNYQEKLDRIIKTNPNDRRIASLAAFASEHIEIKNNYPFCPNPLDYIYESSIKEYLRKENKLLDLILTEISDQKFIWEPTGKTTVKGFGTYELSDELIYLKKLKEILYEELNKYFKYFSDKKINLIKNKPNKFKLIAWSNILKKEGYNIPHIHPSGWVSGVFYLKVPTKTKGDEAGIQFHLHGDDYIVGNKKLSSKFIKPEVGSIVMFPSSLYHSTVPFLSDEERVCIAFDFCGL